MKTRYQSNTRHDTIWGWFRICCLILELKERRSFSPASSRWSYPDRLSTKVTSFTSVLTSVHSVFTTVNWSFGLEKETFYLFKVNMGSKWCRHLVLMCLLLWNIWIHTHWSVCRLNMKFQLNLVASDSHLISTSRVCTWRPGGNMRWTQPPSIVLCSVSQ